MKNLKSKLQTVVQKVESVPDTESAEEPPSLSSAMRSCQNVEEPKLACIAKSELQDTEPNTSGGARSKRGDLAQEYKSESDKVPFSLSAGLSDMLEKAGSALAEVVKDESRNLESEFFSSAPENALSVCSSGQPCSKTESNLNASQSSSDIAHTSVSSDENSTTKSCDFEKSGGYEPGYTGPIHKWQHPDYRLFTEPPKVADKFPKTERLFKVIIVGDATVGKTTFVQRYVNNVFRQTYKGTIGVDFALKMLWKSDTEVIKLQLWDIAGQERFTWMTRAYYRDAHGCVVMFDLTSNSSFINAMKWKKDVDAKCQLADGSLLPAILIGNKCDLPHRAVNQEEVEHVFRTHNYIGWTEVSAKDNLMIHDCMNFLVDAMLNRNIGEVSLKEKSIEEADLISPKPPKARKSKRCC